MLTNTVTKKSNNYITLGVDIGYARLGIGVVKVCGTKLEHVYHNCVETTSTEEYFDRLLFMREELIKVIDQFKPDLAVVEDIYFFKNQKTAVKVCEVRGVVLITLIEKKIKVVSLTPLEIKMGVTGYGRADKKQIQQMVKLLLNLKDDVKSDDAADALAGAISGSSRINLI